ncbi:MAG TPA: hypothetical protein VK203_24375 [Nostocaceae cyanobacterium]|nr:hypothetical protein [Nostocaceae cyanobacterium]
MGRWEDGEMGRWGEIRVFFFPASPRPRVPASLLPPASCPIPNTPYPVPLT